MRISQIVGRLALILPLSFSTAAFSTAFLSPSALADDGAAVSQAMQWITLTAVVVPGAQPLPDADFTITQVGSVAEPHVAKSGDKPASLLLPAGRY